MQARQCRGRGQCWLKYPADASKATGLAENPLDAVRGAEPRAHKTAKRDPLMATTGMLAFGSLIDSPGAEIEAALVGRKLNVRTPFGVEFSRSSTKQLRRAHTCASQARRHSGTWANSPDECFRAGGQGSAMAA
jgi:hypothetical protein